MLFLLSHMMNKMFNYIVSFGGILYLLAPIPLLVIASSQECTQGFMDYELLRVKATQIGDSAIDDTVNGIGSNEENHTYILTDDGFTCSGTITGFLLAVDIRTDNGRDEYPWVALFDGIDSSSMYTLVSGSKRDIILGPDDFSTSGLYNYTLSSPMQYTSAHFIGVHQPDTDNSVVVFYAQSFGTNDIASFIVRNNGRYQMADSGTISDSRLLLHPISASDGSVNCLPQFISQEDLKVNARLVTTVNYIDNYVHKDVFFSDIKLTCDGLITHVIVGLKDNTGQTSNPPEIKIWRSSNGDNSYTQSGPTIPLNYSDAVSDISTDYLRWYNLSVPVPVKEGDVLGIYQHTPTTDTDAVIYYQQYSGPNNYDGSSGQSTGFNYYPLVSVVVDVQTTTTLSQEMSYSTTSLSGTSQEISYSITTSSLLGSSAVAEGTSSTTSSLLSSSSASIAEAQDMMRETVTSTIDRIVQSATRSPSLGTNSDGSSSVGGVVAGVLVTVLVGIAVTISVIIIIMIMKKRSKKMSVNKRKQNNVNDDQLNGDGGLINIVYQDLNNEKAQQVNHAATIDNLSNPMYQDTDLTISQPIYEPLTSENETLGGHQMPRHPSVDRVPSAYEVPQGASSTISPHQESLYSDADPLPPVPPPHPNINTISNATYELWNENDDGKTQLYSSIQAGLCVPTIVQREQLGIEHTGFDNDIYGILEEQYSSISECGEGFFKEEPIYWDPENSTKGVYEQLAQQRYREMPRHEIRLVSHLGSGQFGTVDKGIWDTPKGPVEVAVKTLSGSITEEDEVKFLQEAAINGQFHHPNVVQLCGVVTVGQPIMIVLEYATHGDLKSFLENLRPAPGELPDASLAPLLFKFSHQVARGMAYLSRKKFIHRDLAARNILVDNGTVCKIADFGMSRNLQDETYYTSNNNRIPVKWTAPEAIDYRKYSTQSDVWSYGALLYEIWSVGYQPFEESTNQECIRLIESGYRLPSPSGCPRAVYQIMINCWNPVPSDRPSFDSLQSLLSSNPQSLSSPSDHPLSNLGSSVLLHDQSLYPQLQNKYK